MRTSRFDPVSFVFGALFAAIAVVGLADIGVLTFADLRWLAPGILVLIGSVLVITAARRDDPEPVPVSGPVERSPEAGPAED